MIALIRYNYNQQLTPPAPFVHVTLKCVETGKQLPDLPAQLDTVADYTVVPAAIAEALQLVPMSEMPVSGFGGHIIYLFTYRLELSVRGFPVIVEEVISHPAEPFVLLGRNILNRYRIVLDGPNLVLELT
jgi:predicted aspartyl protease